MKEIIVITIIVIIIVGSGIGIQNYLSKTSQDLNIKLEEFKSELETAKKQEKNTEKLNQLIEEIEKEWEQMNKTWSSIILHEELDNIEMSILELKACINSENLKDALTEIDKTIFLVGHIKEREALKWKNIF